jgi:hypothetical protein
MALLMSVAPGQNWCLWFCTSGTNSFGQLTAFQEEGEYLSEEGMHRPLFSLER